MKKLYLTAFKDGAPLPGGLFIAEPLDSNAERLRLLQVLLSGLGYEWSFKMARGAPTRGVEYTEVEP